MLTTHFFSQIRLYAVSFGASKQKVANCGQLWPIVAKCGPTSRIFEINVKFCIRQVAEHEWRFFIETVHEQESDKRKSWRDNLL